MQGRKGQCDVVVPSVHTKSLEPRLEERLLAGAEAGRVIIVIISDLTESSNCRKSLDMWFLIQKTLMVRGCMSGDTEQTAGGHGERDGWEMGKHLQAERKQSSNMWCWHSFVNSWEEHCGLLCQRPSWGQGESEWNAGLCPLQTVSHWWTPHGAVYWPENRFNCNRCS